MKPLKAKQLTRDPMNRRNSVLSRQTDIMKTLATPRDSKRLTNSKGKMIAALGSFFETGIKRSQKKEKKTNTAAATDERSQSIGFFTTYSIKSQKELHKLNDQKKSRARMVIKQNHPWRIKWDFLVIGLSIWNSFTLPIDIAFEHEFF